LIAILNFLSLNPRTSLSLGSVSGNLFSSFGWGIFPVSYVLILCTMTYESKKTKKPRSLSLYDLASYRKSQPG
jgi:hypothetical protein